MTFLPPVTIAESQVALPLADRCVIRLLASIAQHSSPHSVEMMLAESPPILFWALVHVSHESDGNAIDFSELLAWFQSGQIRACLAAQPNPTNQSGSPIRYSSKHAGSYFRSLRKHSASDSDIDSSEEMVEQLCRLIFSIVPADSESLAQRHRICSVEAELWKQLSIALSKIDETTDAIIRRFCSNDSCQLSLDELVGSAGELCDQSDDEFERDLHREKMAAMKQLAYGASHEINNPLANIASRAQTLLRDETDPERRRKLASINQQAFRGHEMIADMMLFAHPPKPELCRINLDDAVALAVEELRDEAAEQDTVISFAKTDVGPVLADSTQVVSAIKAMVQNAIESLGSGGHVEITLEAEPSFASVRIDDSGRGIDESAMRHLFDPFYSGREAGRGLGFGLSKAWRIAELHGGEIQAENLPHGGARLQFRIPYADAA